MEELDNHKDVCSMIKFNFVIISRYKDVFIVSIFFFFSVTFVLSLCFASKSYRGF